MDQRAPRVLFVGRSTAHFSYFESVIAALMGRGADVELLLDEQWSKSWATGHEDSAIEEFLKAHPGLKIDWLIRRSDSHRNRAFGLRELRAYRSYLVRKETTPFYVKRWRQYLTQPYRGWTDSHRFERFLRSPLGEAWLRLQEWKTPPDPRITELVRAKAPDVVLICPMNMRFSEETDYAKAARKLGIPVAVTVISWDNLSTKGLFHVTPDRLFVWNRPQWEDAVEIQKTPKNRLRIAGAPFFDKWFDKTEGLRPRAEFCAQLGFDPERRILLYLGSSKNIAKNEAWFVQEVLATLRASADARLRDMQILVRPHPANADIYEALSAPGVRVWPEAGALPETRQGFADMRNSFAHADAAVGINTSGMIDAVLAGLPTFSVRIPKYAQTQSDSKHFRYLEAGEALYLTDDLAAFEATLAACLNGDDPRLQRRRDFARDFARPQGLERPAGDVVAEGVLALAGRGRA